MQSSVALISVVLLCLCSEIDLTHVEPSRGWVVDDDGCLLPDNEPGFCTTLNTCETVTYFIGDRDYDSADVQDIIEKYACGVDRFRGIKVCCPYTPLVQNKPTSKPFKDHTNHPNLRRLPMNCGPVRAWGLYNGNEANLFEFGWSVLFQYKKPGDPYICGGSLISNKYILTSASCIRNKYKLIGARLGEHNVRTLKDCTWEYADGNRVDYCGPPPQDFNIDESDSVIHREYNPRTLENNIALIKLRRTADVNNVESVSTVCLPISSSEKSEDISKYTSIGWGVTETGVGSYALQKVLSVKINNSECSKAYGNAGQSTEKAFCLRHIGQEDVCVEDPGGPVMSYVTINGVLRTLQYGIVSRRPSTCKNTATNPITYTNVVPYVGWILDNLRPGLATSIGQIY
ncbi:Trypsin [Oryctes borbonicus]|uniref:CLIP domain-containing serine protease n=1 Tax=Oryctes borbonicus TaxID=1629725 RepID=A0A0T6BBK3_9SCAR|nr:Trypsin [Oryctes borbonicus]